MVSLTLEVFSNARHDLKGGFKAITSDQFLRTKVFFSPPVLFSPRIAIGLQGLLAVVRKAALVDVKVADSIPSSQSISPSVTTRHSARIPFTMRLTYPGCQKVRRKNAKVDSLYSVVETSVNEGSEVILNHAAYPFNQNGVLCRKRLVAWVSPLSNCLLYEPMNNNKRIIVRKFSSFCPAPHLNDRIVDEGRFNLLQGHVHYTVDWVARSSEPSSVFSAVRKVGGS